MPLVCAVGDVGALIVSTEDAGVHPSDADIAEPPETPKVDAGLAVVPALVVSAPIAGTSWAAATIAVGLGGDDAAAAEAASDAEAAA